MIERAPTESALAHVAFYGSLLRPFPTQARIGVARMLRYLRPCSIPGRLVDLGPYPGLVGGAGRVTGELYQILDAAIVARLDAFEEFDPAHLSRSQFVRRRVRLLEPSIDAWAYFYNRPIRRMSVVQSGSWIRHLSARPARGQGRHRDERQRAAE